MNQPELKVDRSAFRTALERLNAVIRPRSVKPILGGVRLSASDGRLTLAGTDGEMSLTTSLDAEGTLEPCVVPHGDLLRRVRASKHGQCLMRVDPRSRKLVLNGGSVLHTLLTLPVEDFPVIRADLPEPAISLPAQAFSGALRSVLPAVARESSRYAIHGVLFEPTEQGLRLVATDGRRLAYSDLAIDGAAAGAPVIVPAGFCSLALRLLAKIDGALRLSVHRPGTGENSTLPIEIAIVTAEWTLRCVEIEGSFPIYRDVIPESGSRFAADRGALIDAVREVSLATGIDARALRLELRPRSIRLSAESPEIGRSSATVKARFLGGGDGVVHTGINPKFMLDALQSLDGPEAVFDVQQNKLAADGSVLNSPIQIHAESQPPSRWLIMPVSLNFPPTREHLGSNYREAEVAA